nr:S8 family serine peptidase [Agrobacterium burrii]
MVGVTDNGEESDGDGVVVAVIDGRPDLEHPTIKNALLFGQTEFLFADDLPIVDHGVGVMSVIAGQKIIGDGRRMGIAPSAKLLPLAISTYTMSSYAGRARAVNFAASIAESKIIEGANNVRTEVPRLIVNCSWKLRSAADLTAVSLAFARLTKSAICVCSAGNENNDLPHFPSEYPGVVRVAALGITGERMTMSNFGTTVTFSAPGGTGTPMDANDILIASLNNKHVFGIGTSFAAPHVSGLLASIWSRHPELDHDQILALAKTNFLVPIPDANVGYLAKLGLGILTLKPRLGVVGDAIVDIS